MGVPTVVTTNPVSGSTGVYKNKIITITFSEDLLSSTVNSGTFLLRNLDSDQLVPLNVSLNGSVVTLTPIRHLSPSTAYKITLVGADTAVGTPIKSSSTSSSFATTTYATFSTGTELEVAGIEKTQTQIDLEGEITLPSNIVIVSDTSVLEILTSSPKNRAFGVAPSISPISVSFSHALDSSTVDANSFQVTVEPYYEEDEYYLAYPDTSDGSTNFKWEEPADTSNVPLDFSDLSGTIQVSGSSIVWTPDSSRVFPNNTKIKIVMTQDIKDVFGNGMDSDYQIAFYVEPFPNVVSVGRVRDEFYPYVLNTWSDDMIGKTLYKNSIDALNLMRWNYDLRHKNRAFHQYVLYATIVDIFQSIKIDSDLTAGQFKRLGDFAIRIDSEAGRSFPAKMQYAMEMMSKFKDALVGYWSKTNRYTVKGRFHPEQKTVWRTRLWKQEIENALEGYYGGPEAAGNTASQRSAKVPGYADRW